MTATPGETKLRHTALALLLAATLWGIGATSPIRAASDDRAISGTITGYECGDNCYLTVRTEFGEDLNGLCIADACQPWNEVVALPPELMGAQIDALFGSANQFDAAGNDMGPYPAFLDITIMALGEAELGPPPDDQFLGGTILGYECGDNCYLTILTDAGEELTGLCVADTCQPWNDVVALPPELLGARVETVVGTGSQFDAAGNDMGPFPAFLEINLLY